MSGLARGIDREAHEGCVEAGGRSVAVLGNGIDLVYPASSRPTAMALLARGGAILSEYPPGVPPLQYHFPARNRIISGLCRAVVVVQAPERSGALITAEYALDQGRDLWVHAAGLQGSAGAGTRRLADSGAPCDSRSGGSSPRLGGERAGSASGKERERDGIRERASGADVEGRARWQLRRATPAKHFGEHDVKDKAPQKRRHEKSTDDAAHDHATQGKAVPWRNPMPWPPGSRLGRACPKRKGPRGTGREAPAQRKRPGVPRRAKKQVLLIVESPAKGKTIEKYLGKGYTVAASMGHLIDLPKSRLAIDVDKTLRAGVHHGPGQGKDSPGAEAEGPQGGPHPAGIG